MKEENEAESAKPEWRDATTYIKGKERIQDKSLIMFETFEILVHKCPDIDGNSWYMSCPKLGLEGRCLFKTILKAAQTHALEIAIGTIAGLEEPKNQMEVFLLNNGK